MTEGVIAGRSCRRENAHPAPESTSTCRRRRTRIGTKSITITEEAYKRLAAHKRPDESFTDVINRLAGSESDVLKGFGLLEGEVDREGYDRRREEFDEDYARHRRELDDRSADGGA